MFLGNSSKFHLFFSGKRGTGGGLVNTFILALPMRYVFNRMGGGRQNGWIAVPRSQANTGKSVTGVCFCAGILIHLSDFNPPFVVLFIKRAILANVLEQSENL